MSCFFLSTLEVLVQSDKEGNSGRTTPDLILYWDSWDSVTKSPHPTASQPDENPMQNSLVQSTNNTSQNTSCQVLAASESRFTPPHTPSFSKAKG